MGKIKELRKHVNTELSQMQDPDDMLNAAGHLYGVSAAAQLMISLKSFVSNHLKRRISYVLRSTIMMIKV